MSVSVCWTSARAVLKRMIEMPFGVRTRVGSRNHVGGPIPRGRGNFGDRCDAAYRQNSLTTCWWEHNDVCVRSVAIATNAGGSQDVYRRSKSRSQLRRGKWVGRQWKAGVYLLIHGWFTAPGSTQSAHLSGTCRFYCFSPGLREKSPDLGRGVARNVC